MRAQPVSGARPRSSRPAPSAPRERVNPGRGRERKLRIRRRRKRQFALLLVAVAAAWAVSSWLRPGPARPGTANGHPARLSPAEQRLRLDITQAAAISALRGRIVSLAESQLGYRTDPPDSYCNKFSAYWVSGASDCGHGLMDEEWCADFAAWVWQRAGAPVVYQYINGDINSSSASFYEWGSARGTWHSAASGYVPRPGDVAVYGLDTATLVAQHVAIVIRFVPGNRGPDTVNGDGDHSGFSVVELGNDQYQADIPGTVPAVLSGYVSPG